MATLSARSLLALPKTAPALYARHASRLPALANVLLVIVIARLLAELVWALVPTSAAGAWQPLPPPQTATADKQIDLGVIENAALFGIYQQPAAPAASDLAAAPDTQLNLSLLGILADDRDAARSRALIGTQGGGEKPYSVGDDISRGVTLQAIFPDRVILSRGGRLETLRLDKDSTGSGLLPAPALQHNQQPDQDQDQDADPDARNGGAAESLAQIRSQLLTDPSKVSDFIRVQPVNGGGGVNGYRVYPGKDRSIFSASGLRPGDIVTAINGVQLNDPAKSLQLLSDLSQNSRLNLTVERGGQPQNFAVSIN